VDFSGSSLCGCLVDMHRYVWIEDRNQAFEVPGAQGCEEGIDHSSLLV